MIRRAGLTVGVLSIIAAVVLALVPLRNEGVSGNAVRSTYQGFGWFSYSPLPQHATVSQLRAAGVQIPAYVESSRRAVEQRRWLVGVLAGAGGVLVATGLLVGRRRTS